MGEPPDIPVRALVVEDDPLLAALIDDWVGEYCRTTVVHHGDEALATLDESFDVVLLDRRMPGLPGDEVLRRIRERGLSIPVLVVSAVQPDYDVIDLPFDDYLIKPIKRQGIRERVEELLDRRSRDENERAYFAGAAKLALLEEEKPREELVDDPRYRSLKSEVDDRYERADGDLPEPSECVVAYNDA